MPKASQFILFSFILLIISVPVFWLTAGKPSSEVSIIEARILELPEKSYPTLMIALDFVRQGKPEKAVDLIWKLFTGGSLQNKFDNAAADQFPLRMNLIKFSKSVERGIINLAYSFSTDTVIPADMASGLYILKDNDALITMPNTFDLKSMSNIDVRIKNYDYLTSAYPKINFYIFVIQTLRFSKYHPLNKYFDDADNGNSYEYFLTHLPDHITTGTSSLSGVKDYFDRFYRTDHHWNTIGILEGYSQIYNLLATNYPNIPSKLTPTELIIFKDIEFHGTFARRTLYPINGDIFVGFEADFPLCTVYNNGVEGIFDNREQYLAGEYATTPYISHYGFYYGDQNGLLEYDCETETDRNILIIGDSYSRPLVALIASQYDHTYYIDLRQDEDFSLTDFFVDHSVDDILVVGNNQIAFMDTDLWYINP